MNLYEKAGMKERRLIEKFSADFFDPKLLIEIELSPVSGYDCFDGIIRITDPANTEAPTVVVVEAKVRNKHYSGLLLERQKLESLLAKTASEGPEAIAIYLNQTPSGIFAFDLTSLSEQGKLINWQSREIIHHTMNPEDGKVTKEVTFIEIINAFYTATI